MTLMAGRATGLRVSGWGRSGNSAQVQGFISGTDVYEVDARRQQLLGLLDNPDESVFPVTWTVDPNVDGFYRVSGVQVGRIGVERGPKAAFALGLERVPTFATPVFESVVGSVVRTNSHGVTTPSGNLTSWYSASGYTVEASPAYGGAVQYTSEDGAMRVALATAPVAVSSLLSYLKPADFYLAQARIEVKYGSTWYPVVGRQIPLGVGINWRLNNGLTRMYPTAVSGYGSFTVGNYASGAAWTEYEFRAMTDSTTFTGATADSSSHALAVTVLCNSPERVTVRTRNQYATYDWTLRRGDNFVELAISQPSASTALAWGVGRSTNDAATATTGGAYNTAPADWLIVSPSTVSVDTTKGRVNLTTAALNAQFAVCADYDQRHIALDPSSDTETLNAFLANRLERQRIVPR